MHEVTSGRQDRATLPDHLGSIMSPCIACLAILTSIDPVEALLASVFLLSPSFRTRSSLHGANVGHRELRTASLFLEGATGYKYPHAADLQV